jgi:hypothetical protein
MNKTGIYGVGLLVAAMSLMVSCGGDDGDNNGSGGSSSGGSSAGKATGGSSTSGSSSGGSSTSGSSSGGSSNGGSTSGGSNNNQGGDDGPGPGPQGGDGPGPGGDLDACGAGVENGEACEAGEDEPCEAGNGDTCVCNGQQDEWICFDIGGGQGGAGPGFDMVDCGDNPMNGDDCEGLGQCEGSDTCGCIFGNVMCGM